MTPAAQALAGLRIVELGGLVSAAYAAKLLADLGADVIKVEDRRAGDAARRLGPFPGDRPGGETSGAFQYLNANKRGIMVDLSTPTGRRIVRALVREADLLIENLAPKQIADW